MKMETLKVTSWWKVFLSFVFHILGSHNFSKPNSNFLTFEIWYSVFIISKMHQIWFLKNVYVFRENQIWFNKRAFSTVFNLFLGNFLGISLQNETFWAIFQIPYHPLFYVAMPKFHTLGIRIRDPRCFCSSTKGQELDPLLEIGLTEYTENEAAFHGFEFRF